MGRYRQSYPFVNYHQWMRGQPRRFHDAFDARGRELGRMPEALDLAPPAHQRVPTRTWQRSHESCRVDGRRWGDAGSRARPDPCHSAATRETAAGGGSDCPCQCRNLKEPRGRWSRETSPPRRTARLRRSSTTRLATASIAALAKASTCPPRTAAAWLTNTQSPPATGSMTTCSGIEGCCAALLGGDRFSNVRFQLAAPPLTRQLVTLASVHSR